MIGPDRILGISAGTVEEAIAAETAGADYIGVGAVFGTSTKKNARNMTVDQLREICGAVSIPVVAIGGIDAKNLMELSGTGVDGVAVVSAIFAAEDPGRAATSSSALLKTDAVRTLVEELLPIAALVTPNIPEAQMLCGTTIETKDDMMAAEKQMGDRYHCAVLLKGGRRLDDANDLLYTNGKMVWFEGKRISNPNTHGTGCTLSSAIASGLAKGMTMEDAVTWAKNYVSAALAAGLDLGKGSGPLNHMAGLKSFTL